MTAPSILAALIQAGEPITAHRPWPRVRVDATVWRHAINHLAEGRLTLLSLWAEPGAVHMALLEEAATADPHASTPTLATPFGVSHIQAIPVPAAPSPDAVLRRLPSVVVLTIDCSANRYPSVGAHHAPAIRLERSIRDLFGILPNGLTDTRPWLDHGTWGEDPTPAIAYDFLPVTGETLHRIPVGPVHAGIIEPGHFRFTCDGETVVRLEQRLGYAHKGIDLLMSGAPVARAARLAGRVSGDSTVAYTLAFARAVEAATGVEPPSRAVWLRAVMAELERLANHFGDVGAICNDASFAIMLAHCALLREKILRACADGFGHRLMMDRIIPGGVVSDLQDTQIPRLRALTTDLRAAVARLLRLYDDTPSLQDRTVGTGTLSPELAQRFGAGGFVGRASGRDFDARRDLPYAPYDQLAFTVPVRHDGDANARIWIRLREAEASLTLLDQLLANLPAGPVATPLPDATGEGMALAEAFRGDVLIWLRIVNGTIQRCHLRDASWFQWPLLEAVIQGNIVADFPLCNKSFNCSYSGHDL